MVCGLLIAAASHCGGVSLQSTGSRAHGLQQLQHTVSIVVAPELSHSVACGIFPDQGSNPMSPVLACRVPTTGSPEKSWNACFMVYWARKAKQGSEELQDQIESQGDRLLDIRAFQQDLVGVSVSSWKVLFQPKKNWYCTQHPSPHPVNSEPETRQYQPQAPGSWVYRGRSAPTCCHRLLCKAQPPPSHDVPCHPTGFCQLGLPPSISLQASHPAGLPRNLVQGLAGHPTCPQLCLSLSAKPSWGTTLGGHSAEWSPRCLAPARAFIPVCPGPVPDKMH